MNHEKKLPYEKPIVQHIPEDAVRLSILWGNRNYYPIVHSFLNLYAPEIVLNDGKHVLDVKINYLVPEISVKKIPRDMASNIIECVEKAILNEYYVLMCVDSCKLSAYRRYNPQGCFPHKLCIYGVDTINKFFWCADYFDGVKYSYVQISYEELSLSIDSLAKCAANVDYSTGGADWITDIELLKYLPNYKQDFNKDILRNRLIQFLEGKNTYGYSVCTYERPHIMAQDENNALVELYEIKGKHEFYGINVFKAILNYYEKNIKGIKQYNVWHKMLYVVYAYHELMYFRLKYMIEQRLVVSKVWDSIINDYKAIVERCKSMLNLGLKYEVTKSGKSLERIVKEMKHIIQDTEQLLMLIINELE